jgi:demethylmenaquinone methyltransferase/2-methoxy-6-polyprenyl-1,4-benzoquinol methylase
VADDLQDRLDEQLRYYRARAPEYDAWALREGTFARGSRERARWFAAVAKLERALDRFHPSGNVLEIAGGTGQWTERLVRYADRLTVVDAAEEVLDLNRRRVGDGVRHIHADVFAWRPEETYDVVFFSFWLSHVPPERFASFWDLVRAALAPGGRVFFIDNLASPEAAALDPEHPGPDVGSVTRHLSDGRAYRIWKVLHRPKQLEAELAGLGWDATVHRAGHFFLHGRATPRADRDRDSR